MLFVFFPMCFTRSTAVSQESSIRFFEFICSDCEKICWWYSTCCRSQVRWLTSSSTTNVVSRTRINCNADSKNRSCNLPYKFVMRLRIHFELSDKTTYSSPSLIVQVRFKALLTLVNNFVGQSFLRG